MAGKDDLTDLDSAWNEALAEQKGTALDSDDDLASAWGAALAEQGVSPVGGGKLDELFDDAAMDSRTRGGDRVLNQEEIDNLLGFDVEDQVDRDQSGIRGLINSALVNYERLPMLEIVFDRLVRLSTTSLRNFTSDNVEVSLESISSVRFGDYLDSIPLPTILGVFKAEQWDNFGLVTVDSSLIYAVIDVLLGGGRGVTPARVEGRPYTTIETALVRRLIEVVLSDAEQAFEPLSPVRLALERLETNPRFAAISRPANAAFLAEFRVDMEDRGGKIEILVPYATLEPIRELLLQSFMGEKFGRDPIWESHLATEIYVADIDVEAVMFECDLPLSRILGLEVGQTLLFDAVPSDPITLRCGGVPLTEGRMGRVGDQVSVRVERPFRRPRMTLAAFEKASPGGRVAA